MKLKIIFTMIFSICLILIIGTFNDPIEFNSIGKYVIPTVKSDFCDNDCLKKGTNETYTIEVKDDGDYAIMIDYVSSLDMLVDDQLTAIVNGKEYSLYLPKKFAYATEEASTDRYGNEILGTQQIIQDKSTVDVTQQLGLSSIKLPAGTYQVELASLTNDIEINDVYAKESKSASSSQSDVSGTDQFVVEAEDFAYKSDSSISVGYAAENDVTPTSASLQLNNIINGNTFDEDKQSITYVFDAPKAGNYDFAISGRNELADGKNVYLKVYLNDQIISDYYKMVEVPTTSNFALNEFSEPIYLNEGENKLTLELDTSVFDEDQELIQSMLDEITTLNVEIQKVTGGVEDTNRSWELSSYIPNLDSRLETLSDQVDSLYTSLSEKFGTENEITNSVSLMQSNMEIVTENSDDLPNYSTSFSEGTASVRGMLISVQNELKKSNYAMDKLMFVPTGEEFNYYKPTFANDATFAVQKLISSFAKHEEESGLNYDTEIDVWVKRPRQYVDVMQKMVDEEFTPKSGIKVNFSIITDQTKLTMANAAKMTPDVAMSLDTWYIYQLALRDGLYDFTENPDITAETVSNFAPGGLNQLIVNDGLYGLPETQDFYALYYRTDIFEENDFEVPDTWQDVLYLLPQLQTQGMDFYIPSSSASSLKTLPSTGYFFLQNNAELFSEDGLKVDFTGEKQQESLQFMVDLYNRYGLEKSIPNFYDSFRDGSVPIGISNFSTYVQLTYAAPEIAGNWSVAMVPGVENDNGEVVRWMPGGTGAQGSVIFNHSTKTDEALEFLNWWNSTDVQSKYIQYLISSYGAEYMWNSSNLEAFKSLPINNEDMNIFLEQAKWIYDIPLTPANYYVERGISDIWNSAVFDGESVRVESEYQQTLSNQELEKRYQEFGYIDENGNTISEYPIPNIEDTERWIANNV